MYCSYYISELAYSFEKKPRICVLEEKLLHSRLSTGQGVVMRTNTTTGEPDEKSRKVLLMLLEAITRLAATRAAALALPFSCKLSVQTNVKEET